MKRIIPLMAALFLVLSCAIPVSADDLIETVNDSFWLDVLDYTQVFSTGNYGKPPAGTSDLVIDLPYKCTITSIDMLVGCYRSDVEIYLKHPRDGNIKFTKVAVEGVANMYRFYGTFGNWDYSNLPLVISSPSGVTWLEFHQINVATKSASSSFTPLYGEINTYFDTYEIVKNPKVSTPAGKSIQFSGAADESYFDVSFVAPEWREYDILDMQLVIACQSISSVSAYRDDVSVPIEVSYISNSTWASSYYVNIQVDLRGLDRSDTTDVYIQVSGNLMIGIDNYIGITGSTGYVILDDVNPDYYYFKSITDAIAAQTEKLLEGLSPESGAITDYKNSAKTQGDKMDEITGAVGSVSKPDVGSMDFSVTSFVSEAKVNTFTQPLAVILSNPWFSPVIVASITLAIAAYLLYGKRR